MKVLIKHKDGSTSGPYECDADGYINLKEQYTTIRSGFLKSLGLEVIPYEEPRAHFAISLYKNRAPDVFLNAYDAAANIGYMHDKIINVTEIKPGEVIVSKEKLADAWDKEVSSSCKNYLLRAKSSDVFENLCKELGLE